MRVLGSITNRIFLASALLAIISIGAAVYFISSRMTSEMAAYDDLEGAAAGAETMLADVRSARSHAGGATGDSAIYGKANAGGILSPLLLVTLASLPTGS